MSVRLFCEGEDTRNRASCLMHGCPAGSRVPRMRRGPGSMGGTQGAGAGKASHISYDKQPHLPLFLKMELGEGTQGLQVRMPLCLSLHGPAKQGEIA